MRCLLVQPIHPAGRDRLMAAGVELCTPASTRPADLAAALADCTAVITRDAGLPAEAIAAAPQLRVIVSHGAGIDAIAVAAAAQRGIPVANTPGTNAQSVAELTVALALAAARRLPAAERALRAGDGSFRERHRFFELAGRRALIVGFGAIGRRSARILAQGFGLDILVCAPRVDTAELSRLGYRRAADLHAGLAAADLVCLHAPLTDETRGLLDAAAFARLPQDVLLVNTARAGLIDEPALLAALDAGRVAAAGLDVLAPDSPLRDHPDVILTPHLGGSTEESLARTALAAADCVLQALAGQHPDSIVNAACLDGAARAGSAGA